MTKIVAVALDFSPICDTQKNGMMPKMIDIDGPVETLPLDPVTMTAKRIAHFDLRRELGRGGMSIVYEARDIRTGQELALKLLTLSPALTSEEQNDLIARFEREARTLARLSHPNVVDIYEIGIHEGQHFLAMEYLHGQTLREHMRRNSLSFQEAYSILTQIAGALDAVHEAGIVHRDVKPLNIMLLPDGTAKLLDFGIARSNNETTITNAGVMIGTPSYMAPEQVKGEQATAATDMWSLGVLSYEMFAGHLPFAGQSVASVLYQVMNGPPSGTPDLPKAIQRVLFRALDKHPDRRYSSGSALVRALKSALPSRQFLPAMSKPVVHYSLLKARWLPGMALFILFLSVFFFTVHEQHPTPHVIQNKIVSQQAISSGFPHTSLPETLAMPHITRALIVDHKLQRAARRLPRVQAKQDYPMPLPIHIARSIESPIRVRHFAGHAEVRDTTDKHITKHRNEVQSASRDFTLPDNQDSYDPEADARIRKSDWSRPEPAYAP